MITTLLFDLDGTLLGLDHDSFLEDYFTLLTGEFSDLIAPQVMKDHILAATGAMVTSSDGSSTNREIFWKDFLSRVSLQPEVLEPRFMAFYREVFPRLKTHGTRLKLAEKTVAVAEKRGLEMVIATNPVFPRQAILERMEWAGIGDYSYSLITSYERMHYCKPQPAYYREILSYIHRDPEECMIVGNDMEEDMVATTLGIKAFLVEEYLIERGEADYAPDYRGSLQDFYNLLKGDGI